MIFGGGFDKAQRAAEPCVSTRGNHPSRIPPRIFDFSVAKQGAAIPPHSNPLWEVDSTRSEATKSRAACRAATTPKNPRTGIFDFSVAKRKAEKAIRSKQSFGVVWLFKRKAAHAAPEKSKMVVGGGFEPPKAELADLQSAPFSHSGIPPQWSG